MYSIFDDEAKKTLLAILRDQWPVGSYTYTDIMAKNPDWMDDVVTEFKVYVYMYLNFLLFTSYIYIYVFNFFDTHTDILSNFFKSFGNGFDEYRYLINMLKILI